MFNSAFDRYYFTQMRFEIKSAQEVFQKRMSQLCDDLLGVEHAQQINSSTKELGGNQYYLEQVKVSVWGLRSVIYWLHSECYRSSTRPCKGYSHHKHATAI